MVRQIPPAAGGVLSYFTRHRTIANLLFVLMMVAGLVALPNMRAQVFPDANLESVTVSADWSQASADDVDSAVVQVLEPALMRVEGVMSSSATARPAISKRNAQAQSHRIIWTIFLPA